MLYIKLFIEREKNTGQSAPECPFNVQYVELDVSSSTPVFVLYLLLQYFTYKQQLYYTVVINRFYFLDENTFCICVVTVKTEIDITKAFILMCVREI